jgi:hypothetical protein
MIVLILAITFLLVGGVTLTVLERERRRRERAERRREQPARLEGGGSHLR